MTMPSKQVKQVVRNPQTGRFESVWVDGPEVKNRLEDCEEMKPSKTEKEEKRKKTIREAKIEREQEDPLDLDDEGEELDLDEEETDTQRVTRLSRLTSNAAQDLETAFYAMGFIHSTPLDNRFGDHDDEVCDEDSDIKSLCLFQNHIEQVCDAVRTQNSNIKPRPFTVVSERAITALAVLAYVLNRGADTVIGQDGDREQIFANLMERDLSGHHGYFSAETWLNEMNNHVRSVMDSMNVALFGQATETDYAPQDIASVTGATFAEHISGAGDIMETTLAHARAFVKNLKRML